MKTIVNSFIFANSLILLCCGLSLNVFAQTPVRQVLFTMSENQDLDFGEYAVAANVNGNKFAAILRDNDTYKCDMIFNGQLVISDMDEYFGVNTGDEMYIDPLDPNGYSIKYRKGSDIYICLKGVVKGPYEEAFLRQDNVFTYKLGGRWYENKNGVVGGPFIGGVPETRTPSGKYGFFYYENEQFYANVNGNIVGSFPDYNDIVVNDYGDYALIYSKEYNMSFVRVNDKEMGPYSGCYRVVIGANGNYAFTFQDENYRDYININGKEYGPYSQCILSEINKRGECSFTYKDEADNYYINFSNVVFGPYNNCNLMDITESGKYIYYYVNESDEYFMNINGNIEGPYFYCAEQMITESGKYAFSYEDSYGQYFVDLNGTIYGPYGWVNFLKINDDGSFIIQYSDMAGITYQNNNGVVTMDKKFQYNYSGFFELQSDDARHTFVSVIDYPYVVIDGETYGSACAMSASYDKERNSFIWNTVEDRQLVVYELRLK